MISYLKGTAQQIDSDSVTILINDIGYQVFMSEADLARLTKNQPLELFCHHHITDRSQELFGFLQMEQKRFFKLLIDYVAGIGPKSALKLLNKIDLTIVKSALAAGGTGQLEFLGLSRKTAEKIIVSLKNKIGDSESAFTFNLHSSELQEALGALINLGYKKSEAETALQQINPQGKNTEAIIKEAFQLL